MTPGHDGNELRRLLHEFRREGIRFSPVEDIVSLADSGRFDESNSRPTAAFTIDDGYSDMLEIAAPIFEEYDCPLTGFVVPGIIDKGDWFWWDKIEWILRNSARLPSVIELFGEPTMLRWGSSQELLQMSGTICNRMKSISSSGLQQAIHDLAQGLEVDLPKHAPDGFLVSDWGELRAAERRGHRFGAHSMTHPILSKCDDESARWEIHESLRRVHRELANPSSVFSYPNGGSEDFGVRESRFVAESGMAIAAVSSEARTFSASRMARRWDAERWRLPRVGYDERPGALLRVSIFP
jgi:peptidoglycan/xylan/chitin deacetylase (PgdA/CDA1 family)